MTSEAKAVLQVTREPKGKLKIKLPKKGARWQGAFSNLEDAVKAANDQGCGPPLVLDFVDWAEAN